MRANRIKAIAVNRDPFPHLVIDDVFETSLYEEMQNHLPDPEAIYVGEGFGHVSLSAGNANFNKLPERSREFWLSFEANEKRSVCEALTEIFEPYVTEKVDQLFGKDRQVAIPEGEWELHPGSLQCRIQGAVQKPHLDNATAAFTCVFYLSSDPALRPFGTILYSTDKKDELIAAYRDRAQVRAWYPDPAEFGIKPVKTVEFVGNRIVAFAGVPYALHGIRTDAAPPRYSIQNSCTLPKSVALDLFSGWGDHLQPDGKYRGGP